MTFSAIYECDDMLYLGTRNQGLWRYDLKRDALSGYADVGSTVVMDMFGDGNRLYVATDGNGLQVVDMESGAVVDSYDMSGSHGKSIRSNSVYSALRDCEGQMWLGKVEMYVGIGQCDRFGRTVDRVDAQSSATHGVDRKSAGVAEHV